MDSWIARVNYACGFVCVLKILWLLASESLNLLRWEILTCCFLFCFRSQPWWLDLSLSKLLLAVALRTNSRFSGHADPSSAAAGAPSGAGHVDRGAGGGDAPPAGSLHPSCGPWPDWQQPTSAALHCSHQERGQGGWRIVHSGDGCYSGLYLCREKSCCRSEGWKREGGNDGQRVYFICQTSVNLKGDWEDFREMRWNVYGLSWAQRCLFELN